MAEIENNNLENTVDETLTANDVFIGVTKKTDGSKLAVTEEEYNSIDKRSYTTDGIILRDEEKGIDILVSPTEVEKVFGEGPAGIPESDERRKGYTNPSMVELDGEWRTQFLLSDHTTHYDDNCAICYCRDYGEGWWLPSGGEMGIIMNAADKINELLGVINGDLLNNGTYWLSTQYSKDYSWHLDFESGLFGFWLSKENELLVRTISDASQYIRNEE